MVSPELDPVLSEELRVNLSRSDEAEDFASPEEGSWSPASIDCSETGDVEVRPLTVDEAREDHKNLLHEIHAARLAGDLHKMRELAFTITILEREFPVLAPETDQVTERDH